MILREAPAGSPKDDSAAENVEIFTAVDLHTPPLKSDRIDLKRMSTDDALWPLTTRLRVTGSNGERWLLDFPVNHINHGRVLGTEMFHVETGPVLVPSTLVDAAGDSARSGFVLAYVFFNRPDRVDLAIWGPTPLGGTTRRAYVHFGRLDDVAIEMYGGCSLK